MKLSQNIKLCCKCFSYWIYKRCSYNTINFGNFLHFLFLERVASINIKKDFLKLSVFQLNFSLPLLLSSPPLVKVPLPLQPFKNSSSSSYYIRLLPIFFLSFIIISFFPPKFLLSILFFCNFRFFLFFFDKYSKQNKFSRLAVRDFFPSSMRKKKRWKDEKKVVEKFWIKTKKARIQAWTRRRSV